VPGNEGPVYASKIFIPFIPSEGLN